MDWSWWVRLQCGLYAYDDGWYFIFWPVTKVDPDIDYWPRRHFRSDHDRTQVRIRVWRGICKLCDRTINVLPSSGSCAGWFLPTPL